jgi:hypothetical protein
MVAKGAFMMRQITARFGAVALLLVLAAGAAGAQQVPPQVASSTPDERAKLQTMIMKEKLGLTPDQLPKVEGINLQAATKMDPILKGADTEGPLMKMRTVKEIETEKNAAMQGVLTPPQYQAYLAGQEEMKQKLEQKLMEKRAGGAKP